jgi:hydrogenase expression/formation protein HypE
MVPMKESKTLMSSQLEPSFENATCPIPLAQNQRIVMGHGSGGRMTHDLISQVFQPLFSNPALDAGNDFAAVASQEGQLVISTDNHIVTPIFFPGGDIGRLAVCGTVNDIAVSGAKPLFLTAGFIIEEGFLIEDLIRITQSMQSALQESGTRIVAGDTKIVEKGKADGVFINTTGFGWRPVSLNIGGDKARPGDVIIVSGTLGDHGIAVLSARGELALETEIQSDVAPLNDLVQNLLSAVSNVHVLRDPTRGGLATTLNEIARQSHFEILLEEKSIPVNPPVRVCCEMLGFDPLYVANEGKLIIILPEKDASIALEVLKEQQYGHNSALIGRVTENKRGRVLMKTLIGGTRILDMLSGEMLPRIC